MSLFGFVKDIGKSLFGSDAEAAEKIKAHIESNNPGVNNLEVEFDDGIVTLSADCETAQALQKMILMAGNVKGVEDVRVARISIAPPIAVEEEEEEEEVSESVSVEAALEQENVEYYIIQKGDSLSKIAKQYFGNAMEYPRLFEENREVIEDPDLIYPGQKIRIPLD